VDTATAAPDTTETMTNLEAQTRCKAVFEEYAAFWTADGNAERAAMWVRLARACQIDIDGIKRTHDDNFCPF
jgi:hypothetical protein